MSDGERMVWAAAYAASWTQLREFKRKYGPADDGNESLALNAADEACGALHELREIALADGDFSEDARAVLLGDEVQS